MPSQDKQTRPWSVKWVFQRTIAVIKEGRLPQIRLIDLWYDYQLSKKIRQTVREIAEPGTNPDKSGDIFNFVPAIEYRPFVVNTSMREDSISFINKLFDHVYVLNLGRRLDRRIEMIQKLNKYRIRAEIFEAEDGYTTFNQKEFREYYKRPIGAEGTHRLEKSLQKKMIFSPGAWGYLKTYRRILEDAKAKNFQRILCVDDDILFHRKFEEELVQAQKNLPATWKLLYLGATQHNWSEPDDLRFPELPDINSAHVPYYHPVQTDGSFAVGIDRSIYDELLTDIRKMDCSLDTGALRSIQQQYPEECFVLQPNLVIADVSQSDIGVDRNQKKMSEKLRWELQKYDYPFAKELVSVIMPAYNAAGTIEMSIRSVLQQTYAELEMIVVDDGSTDGTPEIVEKLKKEDPRIKLLRLKKNMGCYPARNAGLRISKGKYIAIQDSDDVSLATRIETQLIPILTGNAEFTLTRIIRSRCRTEELDLTNQKKLVELVMQKRGPSTIGIHDYRDRPVVGLMSSMFERKLFEELGLFWEHRFGADAEFIERIIFARTGKILTRKDGTLQSYLNEIPAIPGVYERIDKIQLFSINMTNDNITSRYSQEEKDAFEECWRKRLKNQYDYEYPVF